jgi:hypothetical protein
MRAFVFGCVLVAAPTLQAGIYSAAEPSGMRAGPDGRLVELPYVPAFKAFLEERLNAANPATPDRVNGTNTFRGLLKQRVEAGPAGRLTVAQQVARAVDLIRIGRAGDAVNLLEARTRDRDPDFVAVVALAHAYAAKGDWGEAERCHSLAVFDAQPPSQLPGVLPELTKRYVEIEKTHYPRWLLLRQRESGQREGLSEQDVLPLFGPTIQNPSQTPVKWVNELGHYEPGKLAAGERAKLPHDAIAVVQQLLLWSPDDTRLLWLLAELYAANGQLREADQVFDQCTWGRNFTNRKLLMDHRAIVRDLVAALPAETVDILPADLPVDNAGVGDAEKWAELRPQLLAGASFLFILAIGLIGLTIRSAIRRK